MGYMNYSAFAKAIQLGMPRKNMTQQARSLFSFIVEDGSVLNKNGEPYDISNRVACEWYKGQTDIPFEIKDAAAAVSIRAAAPKHFATEIIPQMLVPQKEADVYPAVMRLIEDDHDMAVKTKKELRGLLEEGKKADFLAQSFLYAITKDNRAPASEPPTLSDNLANLQSILSKLSKPVALVPPDELMSHEMIYVQALLDAYAEALGAESIQRAELAGYPLFKKNFDRQRKDYYAAESIREATRDTQVVLGRGEFDSLKQETFDAVVDVCERSYPNGFERLNTVLQHATTVQLSSLLARIPDWIGPSEKKGVCHMLVNDKRIGWVSNEHV